LLGHFLPLRQEVLDATVVRIGPACPAYESVCGKTDISPASTGVIAAILSTLGKLSHRPFYCFCGHIGWWGLDIQRRKKARATSLGCTEALTYLGEPAARVFVGTLFQAHLLPGSCGAAFALYAFVIPLLNR